MVGPGCSAMAVLYKPLSALLQGGLFVADVLYYNGDWAQTLWM